jgi:retron-type reverse transcriptase
MGFGRSLRSAHDALDALHVGIMGKKVNWVLDADIRGFFDAINHEWLAMRAKSSSERLRRVE